jgi:hypothetical protein
MGMHKLVQHVSIVKWEWECYWMNPKIENLFWIETH